MVRQIYETAILYEQHMSDSDQALFADFYRELFAPHAIRTLHDATIGAGGSTLPLAKLGYQVSGSDLTANLLDRTKINFAQSGFAPRLFLADLRSFGEQLPANVDCVISTGNSLPHVDLNGFRQFVRSAASKINDGGLLFFDIRNWDAIDETRPIMHAIAPKVMTAEEHRSVYLLFNWHDNGSVTFTFVTAIDRNGQHESLDFISAMVYYPLLRKDIEAILGEHGFELLRMVDMDEQWVRSGITAGKTGDFEQDFPLIQWYGVLARKQ